MIETVLKKERQRNEILLGMYEEELSKLPKGKIIPKVLNGRTYFYLRFRNGEKICTSYLGKDKNVLAETEEKLDRRKVVEKLIKDLKAENKKIARLEVKI